MDRAQKTHFIKSTATTLGFNYCGISKAEFLEGEAQRLDQWLKRGYAGQMHYLERNFDQRLDPRLLVPDAKSVISLVYNYYPKRGEMASNDGLKIAKYAYGEDYHFVVKDKLKIFLERIQKAIGDVNGRAFVDSAPVHERAWAQKSGLGWTGKKFFVIESQHWQFFLFSRIDP